MMTPKMRSTQESYWDRLIDVLMSPVSLKNLRRSAILIGIYKVLIAHVLLFIALLGLSHAEQMKTMLEMDIDDQKDDNFYILSPFRILVRLQTAAQLVSITEMLLYVLTGVTSIYLLTTILLFVGILKNRSEFVLPWLVVEFIFIVSSTVLVFWLQNEKFVEFVGGKYLYFAICFTLLFFGSMMWYTMHSFYQSLRTMNKLLEIASVALPCPPPGATPFQFRRENMCFCSNGYKHLLSEAPDGNY